MEGPILRMLLSVIGRWIWLSVLSEAQLMLWTRPNCALQTFYHITLHINPTSPLDYLHYLNNPHFCFNMHIQQNFISSESRHVASYRMFSHLLQPIASSLKTDGRSSAHMMERLVVQNHKWCFFIHVNTWWLMRNKSICMC